MPDRKVAPPFVQSTSFDLIVPGKKTLPNGIDLFFIHGGSQDVLKIEVVINAGRWFETKWGSSHFAAHQLSKGTSHKSSFEIAGLFDLYGAHLEVNAGLDTVSISLYSLSKNLSPVLNLLNEILREPIFPEKELEQGKSIYIQNLKINHEKTSFLASKNFRKSIFGEDHPYGKELEENDIDSLSQENLFDYFNQFFSDIVVFVSGKIDTVNEKNITDIFSSWPQKKVSYRSIEMPKAEPGHYHFDKKGSVQSSVRIGGRSIGRSDSDYAAATFTAHILGGYFGSRLMKNIREEKGLTYGIYASLHPLRNASYLVIGADVNKENVTLTFDEIRKELKRLRTEKITFDELETAKNHFIGGLQSELATPFAHADKLKTIYLFGLPFDFYQKMILSIEKIGSEKIIETSEKYFNEDKFFQVDVG